MNSKIEEKAKDYARSLVDESGEDYIGEEIYNEHIEYASRLFTAGYTQAVTDQQDTLSQYKEALRELVDKSEYFAASLLCQKNII